MTAALATILAVMVLAALIHTVVHWHGTRPRPARCEREARRADRTY